MFYLHICVCAEIFLEVNENNGIKREDHLTDKDSSEIQQNSVKLQNKGEKEKSTVTSKSPHNLQQTPNIIKMENKNNVKTPIVGSSVSLVVAPRSPSPKPEVQNEKKVPTPNSKVFKTTTTSPVTTPADSSDTTVPKNTGTVNKIHNVPRKPESVSPPPTKTKASGTSTLIPNSSPKMTLPDVPTASSSSDNPPKANLVPAAQSFGTSSENKPTTKPEENSTPFPPSHKPPKTMGLTVTTATKEASLLRQVQSCPNSLQR